MDVLSEDKILNKMNSSVEQLHQQEIQRTWEFSLHSVTEREGGVENR